MQRVVFTMIALLLCASLCSCGPDNTDFYMFEDISECDNIEVLKSEDVVITVYDAPDSDKNLGDLEYDEFYGAEYESAELDFKIFAYEFSNSDVAKEYYKNETGMETELNTVFLASGGMAKYSIIVVDSNRAYCAYTTQKDSEDLQLFLGEIFSKKIKIKNEYK